MNKLICVAVLLGSVAVLVEGHGYMLDPPARGTAWRKGFNTPVDSNDMGNYCGGKGVQHNKNGGKCGVCGEEYSKANKRLEPSPANKFATGTIVGFYQQGQTIDITIKITAFHKGYYEFRLCENNVPQKGNDASIAVTLDCLNKNLLVSAQTGSTQFPASTGESTHQVKLPAHVTCTACVLQWRYRTANSWGCENDVCASGIGPQEEFVGCADVAITPAPIRLSIFSTTVISPTAKPTTEKPTIKPTTVEESNDNSSATDDIDKPTTTGIYTDKPPATEKITTEKPTTEKPTTMKPTTEKPTTEKPTTMKPTTEKPTTMKPTTEKPTTMKPTTEKPTTMKPTTEKPTTKQPVTVAKLKPKKTRKVCEGKKPYGPGMNYYCTINCLRKYVPYCPPSHCTCRFV